ncbi:Flavin-containing monooxygenase [Balamuthia mandrillaris]
MQQKKKRVAVIGAGAAGLVAARYLKEAGFDVEVHEYSDRVGGTWVYTDDTEEEEQKWLQEAAGEQHDGSASPKVFSSMYRSLRTNLPKEIMAFSDFPFDPSIESSFVTHDQVRDYLQDYAAHHQLLSLIRFNSTVRCVEPFSSEGDGCQRWRVATAPTTSTCNGQQQHETYSVVDAVVVCNGHFSQPYYPFIPGLKDFPGMVTHSHNYRNPQHESFVDKTVLVVGSGASAVDISKEVATVASKVIVCIRKQQTLKASSSDRLEVMTDAFSREMDNLEKRYNTTIKSLRSNGKVEFCEEGDETTRTTEEVVDTILLCTGYLYHYPFLSRSCGVELTPAEGDSPSQVQGGVRVKPLYKHIFHARYPSLCFIGLCFKVLPFPCFEVQTRCVVAAFSSLLHHQTTQTKEAENGGKEDKTFIPSIEAMQKGCMEEEQQREELHIPERKAHMLGGKQWQYYKTLEQIFNLTPLFQDWNVLEEIYNDVARSRITSPDHYRERNYQLLREGEEKGEGEGRKRSTVKWTCKEPSLA